MDNTNTSIKIPSSASTNHHVFGFKIKGIPYIIHLAKIDPSTSHYLWELKVSNLKLGEKLNVFTHQKQANVDIHSTLLYKNIFENILDEFAKHFKNQVKTLIIPFPEQMSSPVLDKFFLSFKLFMKKTFPSLKYQEVSTHDDSLRWVYFSSNKPNDILTLMNDGEINSPSKMVETFITNPKIFKPISSVNISPKSVEKFPEIDSDIVKNDEEKSFIEKLESFKGDEKYNDLVLYFNNGYNYFCNENDFTKYVDSSNEVDIDKKFLKNDYFAVNAFLNHLSNEREKSIYELFKSIKNDTKISLNSLSKFLQSLITYVRDILDFLKYSDFRFQSLFSMPSFNDFDDETPKEKNIFDELDRVYISLPYIHTRFYFSENINYFCNDEILKEKLTNTPIENITVKKAIENQRAFKRIYQHLDVEEEDYTEFAVFAAKKLSEGFSKIDFSSKEVKNRISTFEPSIQSFIFYCKDVFDFCKNHNISFKVLNTIPLFLIKRSIFSDKVDYLKLSLLKLEDTEVEFLFTKLLNDFISKTHYQKDKLLKLDIKDDKERKDIKNKIMNYSSDNDDEKDDIDSFKQWLLQKIESLVFISKEKFFKIDESQLTIERDDKKKKIERNKSFFTLYLAFQNDNYSVINEKLKGMSEEKKNRTKVALENFFSQQIIDSIPSHEMDEIETYFSDSFNAITSSFGEMKDFSEILNEDVQKAFDNPSILKPILSYTDNSSDFNRFLRTGKEIYPGKEVENNVINLTRALYDNNFILQSNMIVVRGIPDNDYWLNAKVAGDYVIDPGCISTSINLNVANDFATNSGVICIFYLKKGTRACYLESISRYQGEYELLLPPGCVFKILSIESRKNNKDFEINKKDVKGIVYRLLLVGTVTTDVLDKVCKGSLKWLELKEKIKPEETK